MMVLEGTFTTLYVVKFHRQCKTLCFVHGWCDYTNVVYISIIYYYKFIYKKINEMYKKNYIIVTSSDHSKNPTVTIAITINILSYHIVQFSQKPNPCINKWYISVLRLIWIMILKHTCFTLYNTQPGNKIT